MNRWILVGALIAAVGIGGRGWLDSQPDTLPNGFLSANGRIEVERIDIATKYIGRQLEILVSEGDLVETDQVIARLASVQLSARIREAEASVGQTEQAMIETKALLAQRQSELKFIGQELRRSETLGQRGFATGEEVDLPRLQAATAEAAVASAVAGVARAEASIEAAEATVDRLRADLVEYELKPPKSGSVPYRLTAPGEIVAADERCRTLALRGRGTARFRCRTGICDSCHGDFRRGRGAVHAEICRDGNRARKTDVSGAGCNPHGRSQGLPEDREDGFAPGGLCVG